MWRRQKRGIVNSAEKFVAAQLAFDKKLDTHVRALLPHVSGHDRSYEADDIKQELLAVLWKCVESYDPDRGAKFNTFAWRSIQHRSTSMIREVTAAKRTAKGGVVSLDVEAIGIVVDEMLSHDSAEDHAMANLLVLRRLESGEDEAPRRTRRKRSA